MALIGLTGATLAGWLGRFWWLADLASHFRLYYLAGAVVAVGLALVIGRWRLGALGLLHPAVVAAPGHEDRAARAVDQMRRHRAEALELRFPATM